MTEPHRITIDAEGNRVIPNVSVETNLLVDKFRKMPPGSTVSQDEIASLLGRPFRSCYSYISSAQRMLLRDHHVLIENVRGKGYRVASPGDKVESSIRDIGGARRKLGKASKKLAAADPAQMDREECAKYNAASSLIGSLRLLSAASAVQKVARDSPLAILPSAEVLKMFSG